jgi:hypothetical protein
MTRYAESPLSTEEHVNSVTARIEKLERRTVAPGMSVYVQPEAPPNVPIGTLWFDTDEPV